MFRYFTPDHLSEQPFVAEMNNALEIPGFSSAWTMPIRVRIEMMTTGMPTPIGLKIQGADLNCIQGDWARRATNLDQCARNTKRLRRANWQRYFLDVVWNREALAQYGLSIEDAQNALSTEVGCANVSTMFEGRERYAISVRYLRDFRSDLDSLGKVVVSAGEKQIPLSAVATIRVLSGLAMIRDENGLRTEAPTRESIATSCGLPARLERAV